MSDFRVSKCTRTGVFIERGRACSGIKDLFVCASQLNSLQLTEMKIGRSLNNLNSILKI